MNEALVGGWTRQAQFSVECLAPLHDLNLRYLDLLAARGDGWGAARVATETLELARLLAALTPRQRAAAARCPYAVFDLRLDDEAYWHRRLEHPGRWRVAERASLEEDVAEFMHLALFYSWHIAATLRLAAQVLLGMSERVAHDFRALPLNALPPLASSEALELEPRFGKHGAFWNALTRAASGADETGLRRVQLFGLQLSAAARLP